tara:strand:+ start:428 stop:979 length:552 start_codon:yes stop_codon:yes gene_type:complete
MKKLLLFSAIAFLSSCSINRIYLTVETKLQIEKAGLDIKQLQFYNSEEIVLARQLSKGELKVAEGKVRIENGKSIEEIIIPANTPGVCELNDEKTLKVSFDKGDGKSIPFLVERKGDMVTTESYFKIGAKKWIRTSKGQQVGKVDYQGQVYNLVGGANSRLMIDKSVLNKVDRNTHVAKGRKL